MEKQQKNVLITGAGKRIGRSIALKLAGEGWNIAIHYRHSLEEAKSLQSEVNALGCVACLLQADLAKPDDVRRLFKQAKDELGILTGLINNASLFEPDELGNLTDESFQAHIRTNLHAPLILTEQLAKQEGIKAIGGHIVNIVDQRVLNLRPDFISYTLSKAALWTLTQTSAMDLAPYIQVNAIGPGPTLPNSRQSQAAFDRQLAGVPLKRGATPEEIAEGVLFLINSNSITGEFIAMDGGQHLPISTAREEY